MSSSRRASARFTALLSFAALSAFARAGRADPGSNATPAPAARAPAVQLGFHYGLSQPLLLRGFNAAVDVRVRRWVFSYSHGQGLDYTRVPGLRTKAEERAGLRVYAPYSTGFGVGFTLFRELYVMADFKLHRFELSANAERAHYSTVTVGAEIGYRFFAWRGLYVSPVVRYWPNVADTAPSTGVRVPTRSGGEVRHQPVSQGVHGVFANVLVGWAFDL